MRITGGLARGIPLSTPRKDHPVRPATDRMREAVFSSLGLRTQDANVLDLYAGSGAYGLEALSRGARSAVFVEADPRVLQCLSNNLRAVERSAGHALDARVLRRRLPSPLDGIAPISLDLVFIDPPYDRIQADAAALLASILPYTGPDSRVVFESPGEINPADTCPAWRTLQVLGTRKRDAPTCHILAPTGLGYP